MSSRHTLPKRILFFYRKSPISCMEVGDKLRSIQSIGKQKIICYNEKNGRKEEYYDRRTKGDFWGIV